METLSLPVSVSLLHSNLVASDTTLAFVSNIKPNPQIHLLSLDSLKTPNLHNSLVKYKSEEEVLHINYLKVNNKWYLILGFYQSLQIWNEDGTRMLGYISKDEITGGDLETYFIGSCCCELINSIVVGSSKGSISILNISDERLCNFSTSLTLYGKNREPISVLCSYKSFVLSVSENGTGTFWNMEQKIELNSLDGPGVSATVGTNLKKFAIVGFGNGEVKVYNMKDKNILCNIWAHTRWITGICKHATRPIFITCAEDGFVNIWAIRNGEIETVSSKEYPHFLLTGVALSKDTAMIVTYDRSKLILEPL
ncbi:hypothetical protein SteCoe_1143 [Stentor coeruleus]|uniref:Uncharacterized protein n=1 Tax=Stentor coeruleus TaxID=5963 RepID=A0A1R2D2P6_9CILI|nr:hypothetical protein SteCoe_1143 [Stentor coeruleus]